MSEQSTLRLLLDEARKVAAELTPEAPGVARGDTRFVPPPVPPEPSDEAESMDGWGFADTRFVVKPNESVVLTGGRYNISNVELPSLMPWFARKLAAPLGYANRNEPRYPPAVPPARTSPALQADLGKFLEPDQITGEPAIRLRHGHGHAGAEIWAIRYGTVSRIPDLVIYPRSHDEVEKLTCAAMKHGACLVPFGGGTNVSNALKLPANEERLVIAVDMRQMNRILWIDPVNRMACIEAGATGRHILRELARYGLTLGHEPDSVEFSTLGGWIATHASGMKKNRYGNIEDIVLDIRAVTARGVIDRPQVGPRESVGTNPASIMFGSEGNYGIVTSAVVKVFPLPEVQRYGSVLLPDLERGLAFLYDLQQSGAVPASVRVMDNTQFHFGQALKPRTGGLLAQMKGKLEKAVVTQLRGFDPDRLAVATIVFEGSRAEVDLQERTLYAIAKRHGGMKAGSTNGERGYQLTFGIAYIRDLAFEHWAIAESFETSVPWSRAMDLYERVRARVQREHERRRLPGRPFFSGRITQVYPTGVCFYFYMGFYAKGVADPIGAYTELEHAAREEILAAGGSLSHHHGVGKIRQDFLPAIYSPAALGISRDVKKAVDPDNLFGLANHGVVGDAPAPRGAQPRAGAAPASGPSGPEPLPGEAVL